MKVMGRAAMAALLMAGGQSAQARIVCKDDYQRVGRSWISTPYCRDNSLARVAREYGSRVSDAAVRNNPNLKREVCRLVGHDIRVQDNCDREDSNRGGSGD